MVPSENIKLIGEAVPVVGSTGLLSLAVRIVVLAIIGAAVELDVPIHLDVVLVGHLVWVRPLGHVVLVVLVGHIVRVRPLRTTVLHVLVGHGEWVRPLWTFTPRDADEYSRANRRLNIIII